MKKFFRKLIHKFYTAEELQPLSATQPEVKAQGTLLAKICVGIYNMQFGEVNCNPGFIPIRNVHVDKEYWISFVRLLGQVAAETRSKGKKRQRAETAEEEEEDDTAEIDAAREQDNTTSNDQDSTSASSSSQHTNQTSSAAQQLLMSMMRRK